MSMKLYAHPFASYCQKVLIALYENDTPFEFRMLAPGDERAAAEHQALWPLKRIPVLVDEFERWWKRASSSSISASIIPGRSG
jgi:glutathione S-transferase